MYDLKIQKQIDTGEFRAHMCRTTYSVLASLPFGK